MTQKGFQQMLTAASAAAAASETDVRVNSVPAAPSPIPVLGYKPNTQTTDLLDTRNLHLLQTSQTLGTEAAC